MASYLLTTVEKQLLTSSRPVHPSYHPVVRSVTPALMTPPKNDLSVGVVEIPANEGRPHSPNPRRKKRRPPTTKPQECCEKIVLQVQETRRSLLFSAVSQGDVHVENQYRLARASAVLFLKAVPPRFLPPTGLPQTSMGGPAGPGVGG